MSKLSFGPTLLSLGKVPRITMAGPSR